MGFSVITVASYRRKIWLLYFFFATLLYFWTFHVKVKLAICNQSKVSHSKEFSFVVVYPRVSLHPGPHHAIEGSSYTLPSCHVTGYPAPEVTWRKSSGPLPQGRVKYYNSALQILHVRKDDSDLYFCSASNLLGSVEKKTLLVVVSPPRFIVKPPAKVFPGVGSTLILHCKATGDPQPVISWKKQDGQLPAGRSHQLINGTLVIRDITMNDRGIYKCIAPYARVLKTEAVTYTEVQKGINLSITYITRHNYP